jgi:hypothetical protein
LFKLEDFGRFRGILFGTVKWFLLNLVGQVEMKIHAALRPSVNLKTSLGPEFYARNKRMYVHTWNRVDNQIGAVIPVKLVSLKVLEDIQPPTDFIPHTSAYYQQSDGLIRPLKKAGLDIKYGINAFLYTRCYFGSRFCQNKSLISGF